MYYAFFYYGLASLDEPCRVRCFVLCGRLSSRCNAEHQLWTSQKRIRVHGIVLFNAVI